jgi:hypothetical protein
VSYPSQPEHWDKNKGAPKHKFKFLVEFDKNSIIAKTFTQNQYMYMIKSITRPKATVATADANDQETRTWFGNVPDPTKRLQGQVSWSPITIKFINQIARTVDKDAVGSAENYEPPDDEYPPVSGPKMAVPDLDHFFSRVMEDMDPSMFGGSAPKEFQANLPSFPSNYIYTRKEDAIAAYLESLSIQDRIMASKSTLNQLLVAAGRAGYDQGSVSDFSTESNTASTLSSVDCKSSVDSFMRASCIFVKFFGGIKIYDLANNLPFLPKSVPDRNLASSTTIKNGYWSLRNPYIKGIDFGSSEYSADDFIEYSLEIGYESARYVTLDYKPD